MSGNENEENLVSSTDPRTIQVDSVTSDNGSLLSFEQQASAIQLINEMGKKMDDMKDELGQRKRENVQMQSVLLGIIFIIVLTVSGLVCAYIYSQIELSNAANDRTSDRLESISEKIIEIQSDIHTKQTIKK